MSLRGEASEAMPTSRLPANYAAARKCRFQCGVTKEFPSSLPATRTKSSTVGTFRIMYPILPFTFNFIVIMAVIGFNLPVTMSLISIIVCSQSKSGVWIGRLRRVVFRLSALPMPKVEIERELLLQITFWLDNEEQIPFPVLRDLAIFFIRVEFCLQVPSTILRLEKSQP